MSGNLYAQAIDHSGLQISLETDQSAVTTRMGLPAQFRLTNISNEPLCVLKWNTPLEHPFNGDIFEVQRDNQQASSFIGRIVKRGQPQPDDFVRIEVGQSILSSIDITDGYATDEAGTYHIRYRSNMFVIKGCDRQLKSTRMTDLGVFFNVGSATIVIDKTETQPTKKLKLAPEFSNCDSSQQTTLDAVLTAAENIAQESAQILQSTPVASRSTAERYTTWFGQYTPARYGKVIDNFNNLYDVMANRQVTFECTCDVDNPNSTFAYVFPNKPYHIHLCGSFWRANLIGKDSKAGTIIHETTHFTTVAGTDDHVYGASGAKSLANSNPDTAIDNADNHEYFAENTPQFSMAGRSIIELALDQAATGSLLEDSWAYYRVSGATVIKLYNLSADLDLYVKSGSIPSTSAFDCSSINGATEMETCEVNASDTVYIGVSAYQQGSYTLLAVNNNNPDPDSNAELVYLPLEKSCRIVDTRGVASPFNQTDHGTQSFRAWGSEAELDAQRDTDGSDNFFTCPTVPGLKPAAMAANVTAVARPYQARGNLVAYASGSPAPEGSLINFQSNNIANASIISLNDTSSHHFDIQAQLFGNQPGNQHTVDVTVDVNGYFYRRSEYQSASGLTYIPLPAPCRIVDTRGFDSAFQYNEHQQSFQAWGSKVALDSQRDVDGSEQLPACVPVSGLRPSAVMANVTVAAKRYQSKGNVVAYPYANDATAPDSSLVNFRGNNIANAALLSLNADEDALAHFIVQARLFGNEAGNQHKADVIIDAMGYFYPQTAFEGQSDRPDMAYVPLSKPCRIVDTRGFDSPFQQSGRIQQSFWAWGMQGNLRAQRDVDNHNQLSDCLPEPDATPSALVANVTAAAKHYQARGNVVVYPNGTAAPGSSLINFQGNNIANASILSLSPFALHYFDFDIQAQLFGHEAGNQGKVDVIVDAIGYFYPLAGR